MEKLTSKKTILIFGISSFVGSNLAEFLKKDFRIIGTYYNQFVTIEDVLTIKCDILNRDAIQMLIYTFRPHVVIYAIGLQSVIDCHNFEKLANALNALGVFNVTTFTERYKAQFIYISTSMIFPGENIIFGENDTPNPSTKYGKTKLSAEFYIQKSCLNYLIFRSCLLFGNGISIRNFTNFEKIQMKLLKDQSYSYDTRVSYGFLDVFYLAFLIKLTLDSGVTNRIFQVSSQDYMNYYEFVKLFATLTSREIDLVGPTEWPFAENKSDFDDKSNDNKRYFKLNVDNVENFLSIKMPTIEDSLKFYFIRHRSKLNTKRPKHTTDLIRYI